MKTAILILGAALALGRLQREGATTDTYDSSSGQVQLGSTIIEQQQFQHDDHDQFEPARAAATTPSGTNDRSRIEHFHHDIATPRSSTP